jgi:hypothetical protein
VSGDINAQGDTQPSAEIHSLLTLTTGFMKGVTYPSCDTSPLKTHTPLVTHTALVPSSLAEFPLLFSIGPLRFDPLYDIQGQPISPDGTPTILYPVPHPPEQT